MGRYRRGHKRNRGGPNRNKQIHDNNHHGDGHRSSSSSSSSSSFRSSRTMTETEWSLLEKYLSDYRAAAYELHRSDRGNNKCIVRDGAGTDGSRGGGGGGGDGTEEVASHVEIGSHKFPPLTEETCRQPYIDLPETLGGKERRRIHSLCAALDLYHTGAGGDDDSGSGAKKPEDETTTTTEKDSAEGGNVTALKRRIVVSVYADGLGYVPDLPSPAAARSRAFPSRRCRPWYYRAHNDGADGSDNNRDNPHGRRLQSLMSEMQRIRQFKNLPEESLRADDSLDMGELESLDLSAAPTPEETPWMLVDSARKLAECAEELANGVGGSGARKIRELAFDLEMANVLDGNSRYENRTGIRTCLIQLTSDAVDKDYVVDPLAPGVWDAVPELLGPLFADPDVVKIGHGIGGMDTSSLHRDFGILVVNAFDTYEASTVLSKRKGGMGLATLCRHYGLPSWEKYKALKHKYQASDWKRRPLDDDALAYGRYDIRFLVTLRKLLMRDLVKMDLIGGVYKKFGSSLDDDSDRNSSSTLLGGTMSSTVSSISENEANDAVGSNYALDLLKDTNDDTDEAFMATANADTNNAIGETANDVTAEVIMETSNGETDEAIAEGEDTFTDSAKNHPSSPSSSVRSVIHASEFPCHHHLMTAISTSQKRCLKLWTEDDEEPLLENPSLISMIKQAAKGKGHGKDWTDANMNLCRTLYAWRRASARKENVHASEVCSLDFLVHVAHKAPGDPDAMRRFSHYLPALLEDEWLPYCRELCDLVISSDVFRRKGRSKSTSAEVIFYSDRGIKENVPEKRGRFFKLLIASAVFGAVVLTMTKVRRR